MSEQVSFSLRGRNPDVLTCIANLSNDEVFTPPEFASRLLDTVAAAWAEDYEGANIWANPDVRFLDPFTKSGVFLREITTRLTEGLTGVIPDLQARVDHILTKQVFGIAITQLTSLLARRSLYCSKHANGEHSIGKSFDNDAGNVWFERVEHSWIEERCKFCGASKKTLGHGGNHETHAYAFIHTDNISTRIAELFGGEMQFDVIIGNPPYQMDDSGHGKSAAPIYHLFVEQAKKLEPRYLSMVIPARWYAGGKGLDDFRSVMLGDKRIRKLVDFENSSEVFPGVDVAGGICYFLWNRDSPGLCEVSNFESKGSAVATRALDEYSTLIRQSKALPIVRKVLAAKENNGKTLSSVVSSRKPFGLPTNYAPQSSGLPCWFTQKLGLKKASRKDVTDNGELLNKWKLLIPPAPIAGQTDFSKPVGFYYSGNTRIAKPGECCTESWLVACAFDTRASVVSFRSYLFTKIVRFLLLQTVVSQHVTKEKFVFVPDLGEYEGIYSDELLRDRWGIDGDEWEFIDSRVKEIESPND